jgi:hypothetical protein
MFNFKKLLEGARVLAPPSADVLSRIKTKKSTDLSTFMAKGKRLELERDGVQLEYIFKHKGRWVIDTSHAAARIVQRGQISAREMEFFFRKMIEKYLSMGPKYTNLNNPEFLFFSKSVNQGMIIAYRRDYKRIDNQKHFIIVTFFPRGNRRARPGTDTIMLERFLSKYQVIEID